MSSESVDLSKFESAVQDVPRGELDGYVVDGLAPAVALAPRSVEEVSRSLAAANEAGLAVVPWGGGTQMGFGNLPRAYDVALDLRGVDGLASYEPDDLTVAVHGGCTLGALNQELGEHGQMLPVDAADPEHASLGGLVAAGLSGPRRYGYAALRDLVIGVTAVLPDGRVAKAGGMVVKNVSGFDMMRLYYGSLGSLAVIVQVNLKAIPRPRAQRTVVARYASLAPAAAAAEAMRLSQLEPTAVVLLDEGAARDAGAGDAPWTLLLRCEGPPAAVVRQAERIGEVVASGAEAIDTLDADGTGELWPRVSRCLSAAPTSDAIRVRVGGRPSDLTGLAEPITRAARGHGLDLAATYDVGAGLVYAGLRGGDVSALRRCWEDLSGVGMHATLLTAPVEVKTDTDVFGREPAGFAVMTALKAQFDPRETLNRGRFAGQI